MSTLHRTQILLERDQYEALTAIARREGRSLSEVVRTFLQQQLDQEQQAADSRLQRQLEALELIRQHRQAILDEQGGVPLDLDVVEMIQQGREEQDAFIFDALRDHRD
ncbi:MAG: ribbon-helix-helix protein, CopG family [Anaerolineae bacterium]|jgi:predicted CopG family antitoxin|nr:ribbon-helix-helix protein, CopG family [Anaerolineae bacterium]